VLAVNGCYDCGMRMQGKGKGMGDEMGCIWIVLDWPGLDGSNRVDEYIMEVRREMTLKNERKIISICYYFTYLLRL
jgi:hypothetical protein